MQRGRVRCNRASAPRPASTSSPCYERLSRSSASPSVLPPHPVGRTSRRKRVTRIPSPPSLRPVTSQKSTPNTHIKIDLEPCLPHPFKVGGSVWLRAGEVYEKNCFARPNRFLG